MAAVLDIPLRVGGLLLKTLYEAPLPLLVLGFFTLIVTGIAFVSGAFSLGSSRLPYPNALDCSDNM